MATVDSLSVRLEAELKGLRAGLDEVKKQTKGLANQVNRDMDNMKRSTDSTAKSFAGLGRAIAAIGLVSFGRDLINAADRIDKLSTRLNISTKALQEYKFIADQSGVAFEALTMGFQRMNRRVAEAAGGTGEAKEILKELNINARELNQLSPDQQFQRISEALAGITNESDQLRAAFKLFDSEGVALLQIIRQGTDDVEKLREEFEKLGGGMTDDQIQAAVDMKDAMNELGQIMTEIGASVLPAVNFLFRNLVDILKEGLPIIGNLAKILAESLFKTLRDGGKTLLNFAGLMESVNVTSEQTTDVLRQWPGLFSEMNMSTAGMSFAMDDFGRSLAEVAPMEKPLKEIASRIKEIREEAVAAAGHLNDVVPKLKESLVDDDFIIEQGQTFKNIFEVVVREQQEAREQLERDYEETFRQIQGHIRETFSDILGGEIRSASDLFKSLGNTFKQSFIDLIAGQATSGLKSIIFGGGGGGAGGGGGLLSGGGGLGLVGKGLSALGGSSILSGTGLGSVLGGVGAAVPYVGLALGAASLVSGMLKKPPNEVSEFLGFGTSAGLESVTTGSKTIGTEYGAGLAGQVGGLVDAMAALGIDIGNVPIRGGRNKKQGGGFLRLFEDASTDITFNADDVNDTARAITELGDKLLDIGAIADNELAAKIEKLRIEGKNAAEVIAELTQEEIDRANQILNLQDEFANIQEEINRDIQEELRETLRTAQGLASSFMSAAASIKSSLSGNLLGDLSPLSAREKVEEARRQFSSIASRARSGDLEAIQQLPSIGNAFLSESRDFNASSQAFVNDFNFVQGELQAAQSAAQQAAQNQQQLASNTQQQLSAQEETVTQRLSDIWQQLVSLNQTTGDFGQSVNNLLAQQQANNLNRRAV